MFCTGMESCHFYARWRENFALVKDMGIHLLRYGPPIHRTFTVPVVMPGDSAENEREALREMAHGETPQPSTQAS